MCAEMSQGTSRKRHIESKSIELGDFSSKCARRQQLERRNGPTQFLDNESDVPIEQRFKSDHSPSISSRGNNQDESSDNSKTELIQAVFKSDGNTSSAGSSYIERNVSPIRHFGRGCHSTRRSLRGQSYTLHSDKAHTNYGNRDQASNRRFQSRGRDYRDRSCRGSRILHCFRRPQRIQLDDEIEQFLQTVDPSIGDDKAEAVLFLASRRFLINAVIRMDMHRERLLRSIKFALSLRITPQLSSSLVATLMDVAFVKTLCTGLENDMSKFTRAPFCWFRILSDLMDILKRLFDFQICTDTFLSDSIICITNLIYEARQRDFIPKFGKNTKVLYRKARVLVLCIKRNTGKTSAMVSGDLKGESEDRWEYAITEPIFPHIADLQCVPKLLPINKTDGYKSFKEYMYIQFSLLREDFVGPLREGIRQFREQGEEHGPTNTFRNIRVYDNVKIVSMVCDQGLNYVVTFDVSKLRQVRWESTGRLKYGSLVCLSHDNFSSMLVGVVVNADRRQRGELHVDFNDSVDDHTVKACMYNLFTMVESTAYFEPYRYVLLNCKNMHESDMSMSRYVVHCQKEICPPKYLLENSEQLFDLGTLCEQDTIVIRSNALAPFMKPEEMPLTEEKKQSKNQGSNDERKQTLERRKVMPDVIAIEHKTLLTEDPQTDLTIFNQTSTCEGMSISNTTDILLEENDTISPSCSEEDKFSSDAVNVKDEMSYFKKVKLLKDDDWPHYVTERFDPSQINAIKNALTNELSIIQGPPGCGKTYIGLEIVKVLLKNASLWKTSKDDGQILVLCHTNHALDQFMEGIKKSFTGGILRVGGRSSSEILHSCNLTSIRSNMRAARLIPDYIYKERKATRGHKYALRCQRIVANKMITILRENIIHENALDTEMGTEIAYQFKSRSQVVNRKSTITNSVITSMIYDWLGIDDISREVEYMIVTHGLDYVIKTDTETQQHEERDVLIETNTSKQYVLPEDRLNCKDEDVEKKLERFMKETVALDIASLSERPTDVDFAKWKIMRWHRLELIKKLQEKLRRVEHKIVVIHPGSDIYDFTMDKRWCLYTQWVDQKCHCLNKEIENGIDEYKSTYEKCNEVLMLENIYIMKMADVIGMTTSCAAKHSLELQECNAKILIIEEAAEILESHLVSNIVKGFDQLILIGDHQQLRPKHSYYKLAKQFNIDISMFERLISSKLEYTTLAQQHRMAPVIANIIRHIYPNLVDHIYVKKYGDILGMKSNMVFLNHRHIEECKDGAMSKKNNFEATFSIALATYFIQQGYKSSQVTILTTYKEQQFEIMTLKTKEPSVRGVKVTVVDNFQGEECDIIILSLVRSNLEGKIGFLADDNRVCVALSRAKYGLYVLGNIEMYNTPLWKNILTSQSTKHVVMQELQLKCQNHPSAEPNLVSKVEDFAQVPDGGCSLPCLFVLSCGHVCPKPCHIVDKEHYEVICQMPCERKCKNGHDCNLICGKTCRCEQEIEARTLQCGHLVELRCHSDTSKYLCKQPCSSVMECGHTCPAMCGTTKDEYTMVHGEGSRQFSCDKEHVSFCNVRCDAILACGHTCTGTCSQCFYGTKHIPCFQKCKHSLICDHACPGTCNSCKPCQEPCKRWCKHKQCFEKCSDICSKCTKPCVWKCRHFVCKKQCSEPCNRPRCDRRCRERLRCGHKCIGLCGEPCPIYCQRCKRDDFNKNCFGSKTCPYGSFVLLEDCGHAVEYKLLDSYFDNDESDELVLKQCPICSIPIYNCRRYGDKLNKLRDQIDRMKVKILGNHDHYLPILLGYKDSFDEILKGLNVKNVNILNEFIKHFRENYIVKYGDIELSCNTSGTATKQWIHDCTNEMYRICDSMTILSIDQEEIEGALEQEQFLLLEEDVLENMSSKSPYTAEKRRKTIELIRLINGTTKQHVLLANVVIELKWEGADEMTHSHIFGSGIQRCKIDIIDINDGEDVKQNNEWLCIDSYSDTEAEMRENGVRNTKSDQNNEVVGNTGGNNESKMDPSSVLDLPRTLTLYTLPCPEYFQCRKAPFPEEFRRITTSLSDGKRHNKRTRHDRRDDSSPNKRQRDQSEISTSKREANIKTVYDRKHQHGTSRHSSKGSVNKTIEAHVRHTGSKLVRRGDSMSTQKQYAKDDNCRSRSTFNRQGNSINKYGSGCTSTKIEMDDFSKNNQGLKGINHYKRHNKRTRHDRRDDIIPNKRERVQSEHSTSKREANIETVYERKRQHGTSRHNSRGRVDKTIEAHVLHTGSKLVRRGDSMSTQTQYAKDDNSRSRSTFDRAGNSIITHGSGFTYTKIEMDDLSKNNQGLKGINRKQKQPSTDSGRKTKQRTQEIDRQKKSGDPIEKPYSKIADHITNQNVQMIDLRRQLMIDDDSNFTTTDIEMGDKDKATYAINTKDNSGLTESVRNINLDIGQDDKNKSKEYNAVTGEKYVRKKLKVTLLDTSKVAQMERNTDIDTDRHHLSHNPQTRRESIFKRLGPRTSRESIFKRLGSRVSLKPDDSSPLQTNEIHDHKDISTDLRHASIADQPLSVIPSDFKSRGVVEINNFVGEQQVKSHRGYTNINDLESFG